jgi:hypothetical protein
VIPEEGDAVRGVRAAKRLLQALDVVDVRGDDLGALPREFPGLVGLRVSRQGAGGEASARIGENRPDQSAPLGACRSGHRNDPLLHWVLPPWVVIDD